ncbi:hypothetical protein ABQZ08_23005 [Xanthomonas hortorum pv. hederae]
MWIYALPRAEGRMPNDTDGRQWRWIRLDRITQIMTELAAGDPADESGQYIVTVTYPQYACRACEQVAAEPVAAAIIERG